MAKSVQLMLLLYFIASILVVFSISTIFYQYIAALGSLDRVLAAFGNDRILTALWLSISSAFVTVIFAILLGVPLAYVFATTDFPAKSIIETLTIDIPQTFPPIAEGLIFLIMFGPGSPINIAFTFSALVISKLFIAGPFTVSFVARRFREIKKTGANLTARSLGANQFQVFTTIYLPLSVKDIAAGSALCWSRAMGELGGSLLFAGVIPGVTETLPTFIATQANTLTAAALAATILGTTASTIALVSFKKISEGEK